MDIAQGLKIELSSLPGLSDKVFPVSAPKGTKPPYLVYSLSSVERLKTLSTPQPAMIGPRYQVDIYHAQYPDLIALMSSVASKLLGISGTNIALTGPFVQEVEIENEFDGYEQSTAQYHGIIECRIYY